MTTLAGLALLFAFLMGLMALIAAPIVIALFVVAMVLKLVFFILFLPFRMIGWLLSPFPGSSRRCCLSPR